MKMTDLKLVRVALDLRTLESELRVERCRFAAAEVARALTAIRVALAYQVGDEVPDEVRWSAGS